MLIVHGSTTARARTADLVVATGAELEAALATAEYLVCYPNVRTGDAFYRAAPSLRLHQLLSAGYDDVDLEAARRAKVPVCNNGGANAISVAEHAMMLMLTVSRRVRFRPKLPRCPRLRPKLPPRMGCRA